MKKPEPSSDEDHKWREYVSQLAPDDERGAFLLPDELPNERSTLRQIRSAIDTATRRALGLRQHVRVQDYVLGKSFTNIDFPS